MRGAHGIQRLREWHAARAEVLANQTRQCRRFAATGHGRVRCQHLFHQRGAGTEHAKHEYQRRMLIRGRRLACGSDTAGRTRCHRFERRTPRGHTWRRERGDERIDQALLALPVVQHHARRQTGTHARVGRGIGGEGAVVVLQGVQQAAQRKPEASTRLHRPRLLQGCAQLGHGGQGRGILRALWPQQTRAPRQSLRVPGGQRQQARIRCGGRLALSQVFMQVAQVQQGRLVARVQRQRLVELGACSRRVAQVIGKDDPAVEVYLLRLADTGGQRASVALQRRLRLAAATLFESEVVPVVGRLQRTRFTRMERLVVPVIRKLPRLADSISTLSPTLKRA